MTMPGITTSGLDSFGRDRECLWNVVGWTGDYPNPQMR
jgi:hypothetical protein